MFSPLLAGSDWGDAQYQEPDDGVTILGRGALRLELRGVGIIAIPRLVTGMAEDPASWLVGAVGIARIAGEKEIRRDIFGGLASLYLQ